MLNDKMIKHEQVQIRPNIFLTLKKVFVIDMDSCLILKYGHIIKMINK
jgi:hypothetical protein